MSKFVIACPACDRRADANTGFFARKKIKCVCGFVIDVHTDKMASRECSACGNMILYDQSKGKKAKCPVCQAALNDGEYTFVKMHCRMCGCELSAKKTDLTVKCPVCDTVNSVSAQQKIKELRESEVPTVISYEGDNQTFVWKHPLTDFVMGSILVVHETQEAIFFKNGEALDTFSAGRYTLESSILPKMEHLYKLPIHEGEPFHAEVYFINLATHMGIKWGTNSKVRLFDPASGMHVELGASGAFNLRVTDARRLLLRVVGTTDGLSREQVFSGVNGYFRSLVMMKVKANLARIIKENQINVLEIDAHLEAISNGLLDTINTELEEYGLTMPEFYVGNVVMPDEDPNFKRMKQQYAEMHLRVHEEEIRKAEAEAAFARKSVEAQTAARMRIIDAQGEAEAMRLQAEAQADAYRMKAEAEAQEMRLKGYTYQHETSRQVGIEAMRGNGGAGGVARLTGDLMGLGVGLGAMGSVVNMTRDAINPVMQVAGNVAIGWNCACGQTGVTSNFCPNCGTKKKEELIGWDCACGQKGIMSNFCPECGCKRPEKPDTWNCNCGQKQITSCFCPNCGARKEE